ncbi:MAG: secretin N-terminal domain-containing protein, partial [Planctomycetota bacterium]
ELIEQLDTPYRGKSKIHFRTLKYKEAEDVADLLQELISGTSSGSRSTASNRNRNTRTNNRNTRSNTATTSPFGTAGEDDPVIIPDDKSNSLIIHATQDQFSDLGELIDRIDTAQKQVLIETALVELTTSNNLDFGVDAFGVNRNVAVDTDGDGVADTFTDSASFFGLSNFGNTEFSTIDVNGTTVPIGSSPALADGAGLGLTAGVFKDGQIPVLLSALESQAPTRIVTMPSVVTSDNQAATISSERTAPFQVTTFTGPNQTPQTTFDSVTAETTLTISPSISADDFLRLNINQVASSFGAPETQGARPPTLSRSIETELMVPDASTVVLGGLVESENRETRSGIPLLMDIPVIGFLFSNTSSTEERRNLFLFVTPRILHDLENFTDFHALTWEKKLLQDRLFGEEVDILNSRFLGPNAPGTADEAMRRIENSGLLEGYRYQDQPTDAERVESARKRWEEMKAADENGDGGDK